MNDSYREIMVRRLPRSSDTAKKAGMIVLIAALFAAGLFVHPLFLIAGIGACIGAYFLFRSLKVEYEYLYINGDIDVDKILNREKRKKAGSFELANMQIIAPSGSHDLDVWRKSGQVLDFTSGDPQVRTYTAVYQDKGTRLVALELDRDVLEDLRRRAPRRVSRECFF